MTRAPTEPPATASARRVALVGLAAIGVSYGFARYGYGLFLPQLRGSFDLSVTAVGLIGSATYVGYLVAVILAGVCTERWGPRAMVVAGGLAAAVGMTMVAFAPGPVVLVAGLVLAGGSPGLAWAPYSDAVDRVVPEARRPSVLGTIASGTSFGIVVAGPAALLAQGTAWRYAWVAFAAIAVAVTIANAAVLPGRPPRKTHEGASDGVRGLLRLSAARLLLTAFLYGITAAVYWSFAVELVSAGDATSGTTPLFWTLLGVSGTAAVVAGRVIGRLGLRRAHVLLFTAIAVATALLGIAPHVTAVAVASAVVYGAPYMAISGLLAIWSHQIFPDRPSSGFSLTVLFLGAGSILGPALFGLFADAYGLQAGFLVVAAVTAATLVARPPVSRAPAREERRGGAVCTVGIGTNA